MKKKLYIATIKVAVNAEACGNTEDGACDFFTELLSENPNVFDWTYKGSRKGSFPKPKAIEVDPQTYEEGDLFK